MTIVQVIYQNYYNYNININYYLSDEYEFGRNIMSQKIFKDVMQEYFKRHDTFDSFLISLNFDFSIISKVSLAIIKAFISEFSISDVDFKILLNDYLIISKKFCDFETKIINKILDEYIKNTYKTLD